jgi:hypothetical protein
MKPHQDTTPQQAGPSLGTIGAWAVSLHHVHQQISPRFARPETRQHALLYLQAIMSDIPRKNGCETR